MRKLITIFVLILLSGTVKSQINMLVKPEGFLFMDGKDSVCFYQKTPKHLIGEYSRSNYVHPLYGMDGMRLTEDFPADHIHQRGVFWAWHQIFINGEEISNGWLLKDFKQNVSEIEFQLRKGVGVFNTVVNWESPRWKEGKEPYLQEKATISFYPKTNNYRRIDFEIHLKALADRLSIGGSADEKGYGGFSARIVLPEDVVFESDCKIIEPLITSVDAGYEMKISGSFLKNGAKGGIVICSNPENPKPANRWILRNKNSMQNALYPGRQPVSIPFDEPLVLRYSLLVFQNTLSEKQIRKALKN